MAEPMAEEEERPDTTYPTCLVRIWIKLEDFGQPEPEEGEDGLIELSGIPISAVSKKNSYNEADTFEATVDFEKFPIDSRVVKGATVQIYMADAESLAPNFWETRTAPFLLEHCVALGVVDHCETGIGEDGRQATIKGRDYTAYFLDVQVGEGKILWLEDDGETKRTFVSVIEGLIADDQSGNRRAIQIRDPHLVDEIYPGNFMDRGTDTETGDRKKKQGETIWQALQNIALYSGHILYIDLDEIVVRRPKTLYLVDGMDESNWYRWTVGEDVSSFRPNRKMGRQQGIKVRCVSWSDDGPTLISVRPTVEEQEEKSQIGISQVGGESPEEEPAPKTPYRTYTFNDITKQDHLNQLADELYELVRHHELEGTWETGEMRDSTGREMWRAGYGDPVVFEVSESVQSLITLDQATMIRRILAEGYGEKEAATIALTIKSKGVPFYIHSLEHRFSVEEGYKLKGEFRTRRVVEVDSDRTERLDAGTPDPIFAAGLA